MPRKKKKNKNINIKSTETKIITGMVLLVLGLTLVATPFVSESTVVFDQIRHFFGFSSLFFGLPILYLSINLITKGKKLNSTKQGIGLAISAFTIATLLAKWMNPERMNDVSELSNSGGILGRELHLFLSGLVGEFIEIIIILLVLIVAFSLITDTKLEQISDLVAEPQIKPKFSFKNLFSRKSNGGEQDSRDDNKGVDDDQELVIKTTEDEVIEEKKEDSKDDEMVIKNHDDESMDNDIDIDELEDEEDDEDENSLQPSKPKYTDWQFPSVNLLQEPERQAQNEDRYRKDAVTIETTLRSFDIEGKVVSVSVGPTVVRYSISIPVGIRVSKIKNLGNDLALALASQNSSVRIETPIPGTSYIGVEIPNPIPNYVYAKDMVKKLKSEENLYELPLLLGKDITGRSVIKDLTDIPHLLVAGATGTGKSVGVNSIITGLLYTKTPDEVKLILVDPKMVELSLYNGLPHLLNPVITDMELVSNALQWCIQEMNKRYRILKKAHVKKISEYNKKMGFSAMPYIVVVIDEMADLMLTVGTDVESKIQRLAQMGRAVGLHLILATQRPSVKVITGLIKANVPGRIAYAVATAMESRIILDQTGAETLLGNGDMLYKDNTTPKSIRVQGTLTDTKDTENILDFIKEQVSEEEVEYSEELTSAMEEGPSENGNGQGYERDDEFEDALNLVINADKASASYLQRKLRIGYNKAARIMDQLHKAGAIGPQKGSKPRDVLVRSADQILGNGDDDSES
jgi:S-DNA-T family DNA segregation ATPase FtsK/SpoIIIE